MNESIHESIPNCIEPLHLPQLHKLREEIDRRRDLTRNVASIITEHDLEALTALPDLHGRHRVYFPSDHLSLSIDSRGTCDIDDAVSLTSTGKLLVHVADPTRYLLPAAASPALCNKLGCLLRLALNTHGSLFLPSTNIAMLPRLLTTQLLSLGAPLCDGSSITIELCPSDSSVSPQIYLSNIPAPLRISYAEADKLLNEGFASQVQSGPVGKMIRQLRDIVLETTPSSVAPNQWHRWNVFVKPHTDPYSTSASTGAGAAKHIKVSQSEWEDVGESRSTVAGAMNLACIAAGSIFARLQDEDEPHDNMYYGEENPIVFAYRAGGGEDSPDGKTLPVKWTTSTGQVHHMLNTTNYARFTSPMRRLDDFVNHVQFKAWLKASERSLGQDKRRRGQRIISRLFGGRSYRAPNLRDHHLVMAPITAAEVERLGEVQSTVDINKRLAGLHLRNYWTVERLRRDAASNSDTRVDKAGIGRRRSSYGFSSQKAPMSLSSTAHSVQGEVISMNEEIAALRLSRVQALRGCACEPTALVRLDRYGVVIALRAPTGGKRVSEGEKVAVRLHTFDVERGEVRATAARQTFAAAAIKRRVSERMAVEEEERSWVDVRGGRLVAEAESEDQTDRVANRAPKSVPDSLLQSGMERVPESGPQGVSDRVPGWLRHSWHPLAARKSPERKWTVLRKASRRLLESPRKSRSRSGSSSR